MTNDDSLVAALAAPGQQRAPAFSDRQTTVSDDDLDNGVVANAGAETMRRRSIDSRAATAAVAAAVAEELEE